MLTWALDLELSSAEPKGRPGARQVLAAAGTS